MFLLAITFGLYAYVLFFLGIGGWLYKEIIGFFTIYFFGTLVVWKRESILHFFQKIILELKKSKKEVVLLLLLLLVQAGVNFLGALGPELAFDALWYHLTLPKIWLLNHSITFIPGGLLYYSAMPKLGELLFIPGLVFGNEIVVKLIHFSFGLLVCLVLYKLQRKFFNPVISLIGVVIFYSNLVVAWESITAYVDLIRAFFEIMALWGFINWWESKNKKWFILSACMLGFAITTKLLALGSLVIFIPLIIYHQRKLLTKGLMYMFSYAFIALSIPLPWFIFSYIHTGNIVYPFFSEVYKVAPEPISFVKFFTEIWNLFINAADPISPLYLLFLPLLILYFQKFKPALKLITIYSALALVMWYFTPRTGGGRFILPYLPAFSILCAAVLQQLQKSKKLYEFLFIRYLFIIIICIAFLTICYRGIANEKYLSVILGQQTEQEFLAENLNYSFGDFYDIDNYFRNHITPQDRVLLYGFHNLYYVHFPFIDSSWVKEGDSFTYIATQNTPLPATYKDWKLVYTNDKTMVNLYKR